MLAVQVSGRLTYTSTLRSMEKRLLYYTMLALYNTTKLSAVQNLLLDTT
ncbi:hypothetical protein VitviT2T_028620 [Vitis vinifera]|uniref:Uncharacterized protein n=1 Tax=Vitis vinifera TaxID=29760 RepID=A0ABY9DTN5_VITVI|nr:hypothetical protein VitviT2T_028620 [Vitis vinifera]